MPPPPSLAMLWESSDPHEALAARFGLATPAAAQTWVADALAAHWALSVDTCERIVVSAWNAMAWISADGRELIAKWSAAPHLFPRLREAAAVAAWLHGTGLPAATYEPATDGCALVEVDAADRRHLLGVMEVRPGALLDVTDAGQVRDAGLTLAELHEGLARYRPRDDGRSPRPGEHLLHNDFRSSNVLHDGERVTAVLDFEEITYGNPLDDLAKAAVLLGCQYREWAPTTTEVRQCFIEAYESHIPLSAAQHDELHDRMRAVLAGHGWA